MSDVLIEKKISACEKLRDNILQIEELAGHVIFFDEVLLENEYNETKSYEILAGLNKNEQKFIGNEINNIEKERMFFGEKLWKLFFIYRAFLWRCLLLYKKWLEKRKIVKWTNDEYLISLIGYYISDDHIQRIMSFQTGSMRYVENYFKSLILEEIWNVINKKIGIIKLFGWLFSKKLVY